MRENTSHHEGKLQSVQNALRILQMLQHQPSIKAVAVGEELGLGTSTVYRLLATLEAEGFVQRDRVQRKYRAGRTLIAIGIAAVGDLDVRRKARAYLDGLALSTGETAHLFILEGPDARIIDSAEGSSAVRVAADTGLLVPAHASAGGKALLAALSNSDLHSLFPRGLPHVTAATLTTWEAFEAEIDVIRKRGYAVNHGEFNEAVAGVAVPIVDRARRLVAALALAVPLERFSDERAYDLADELRQQARLLADTLI
ncbi:IclR family transcriptional regulator [Streptomyces hygroscopicus]|uniref:IclR family transcriptional regulator n=1 Tax=Streptomyces hygroscopicus TaxID=1912 RepID=UPI0007C72877|nr:IclR family transcriptional regulator [Streptomyces hygroscopicus]